MQANRRLTVRTWWIAIPLTLVFIDRMLRYGLVDGLLVLGQSVGVILVVMLLAVPVLAIAGREAPLGPSDVICIAGALLAWYAALLLASWLPRLVHNWDGMVTASVVAVVLIWARSDMSLRDLGVTLSTDPGWLRPSAAMLLAVVVYVLVVEPGKTPLTGEELAVNLTMPGISEELFFRGWLLGILDHRLGRPWKLWGADVGWGLIITIALFALVHVVQPLNGVSLYPRRLLVLPLGLALGWIRERSGTVIPAIVVHNLGNTVGLIL